MYRQDVRTALRVLILVAILVVPSYGASGQEKVLPELTADTRIHVAGPDMLFLDGVTIGGQQYAVYLSSDTEGRWRVTSVEPADRRALPADVYLDLVELSTPAADELRIDNVYLDGEFYSGTVAFDSSFEQVRAYEFSATSPPDASQHRLIAQVADSYGLTESPGERAAESRGDGEPAEEPAADPSGDSPAAEPREDAPAASPPPPPVSADQDVVLQRLDEYARQGAQRLEEYAAQGAQRMDRIEAHLDALTQRVDAAVEAGSEAVSVLMNRVTGASGGASVDDVAPTLSLARARAQMSSVETLDLSAGSAVSGTGEWHASDGRRVTQTDADARFAKLLLPYRQDSRPRLYRMLTRASGDGWAGVGLHLSVTDVELPAGYGHGRSLLVWLTRDVQVYGRETTFLEVYISYDDVTMNRVAQSALDSDLSETTALEVLMDPGAGMLTVAVDGVEQFRYRIHLPQGAGLELALRALGRGEFSDLEVRRR